MPMRKPDPIDSLVGQRVKTRRCALSMSQEKLANAIGVTFQQVQKYENGKNRISSSRLMQIANALQVSPASFFNGIPGGGKSRSGGSSPTYVTGFLASADGPVLMRAFIKLPRKLRQIIVRLVEGIADNA
jgi:transcriptional regulator with XRE-family HTH domain